MFPTRAKAFRIELPRAGILFASLPERFTRHLVIWREGHFEFSAGERGGGEGLAVEEGRLNVVRRHGCLGNRGTCREEYADDS